MYHYPQNIESKIPITVPEATELEIGAWELWLKKGVDMPGVVCPPSGQNGECSLYRVPEDVGPGIFALVWDGSVRFVMREAANVADYGEGGLGVASLNRVQEIQLADGTEEARVAVIGVFEKGEAPDLSLPRRGNSGVLALPMTGSRNTAMTLILRRLDFSDQGFGPEETWPRPGYFLTTVDGPQAGAHGDSKEDDPTEGMLDFVALPENQRISLEPGSQPKRYRTAYIIDFYVDGDDVRSRDPIEGGTEPGCQIRCWGP